MNSSAKEEQMRVVFVHGACVRDGAWWWHRTEALLRDRGVPSRAPLLPSCGETGRPAGHEGPEFSDDVTAVRGVLADSPEPTVVVAHSYGGIVTAEAATGMPWVRRMVLISSYLPEIGESLSTFGGPEPAPFLDPDLANGTFGVRPEFLAGTFLQDCPDVADDAAKRLARQTLSVVGQPVSAAAWKQVPTTYVVCARDRGTPAEAQRRFAERADEVLELDTGHHPFLSQPDAVAHLLTSTT